MANRTWPRCCQVDRSEGVWIGLHRRTPSNRTFFPGIIPSISSLEFLESYIGLDWAKGGQGLVLGMAHYRGSGAVGGRPVPRRRAQGDRVYCPAPASLPQGGLWTHLAGAEV